ncbi:MAG: vanadium-dependent haloperoxidase [Acidimicrobiales bacterium]
MSDSPDGSVDCRDDYSRRQFLGAGLGLTAGAVGSVIAGRLGGALIRSGLSATPAAADSPTNTSVYWNTVALEAIRTTHPGPPMAARALAVMNTAMFDSWAAYDAQAVGTQLGGALRRPPSARTSDNKAEAVSFAAYRTLVDLFPTSAYPPGISPPFAGAMQALGYNPADDSLSSGSPSGIGNQAAAAVLTFRHADSSNQLGDRTPSGIPYADYTGYAPVNAPDATLTTGLDPIADPDRWQPLVVPSATNSLGVTQHCIAPFWGQVTPFALASFDQFPPSTRPATVDDDDDAYRTQADEILQYSASLTDAHKMIAEYWADGPHSELPPGHWNLFAQYVSHRDGHTLDDDIRMFFALSNAVFDASVACWGFKRRYDSVRPVTAVHYLYTGKDIEAWAGPFQGTRTIDGAIWRPYQASTVVTPPFQEFTSGHSTFSAAAAQVLFRFTGSDAFGETVTFAQGSSAFEAGVVPAAPVTLAWPTFSAAADEAGLSRRYGGIHFATADLAGRAMGRPIGDLAFDKAQTYIDGTAANE